MKNVLKMFLLHMSVCVLGNIKLRYHNQIRVELIILHVSADLDWLINLRKCVIIICI